MDAPAGMGTREAGPAPASDGGPILVPPEPRTTDGGVCPALSCPAGATQYCGDIGDNCGQTLHCGACPADQQCKNNVCAGSNCLTGCSVRRRGLLRHHRGRLRRDAPVWHGLPEDRVDMRGGPHLQGRSHSARP